MRIAASQARHFVFWLFGGHLALAMVLSACSVMPHAAAPDRVIRDESGTNAVTEIMFYYPISVGGPIPQIVEQMVQEFHASNPDVHVTPVFAGSYADSFTKIVTALDGGGAPPAVAVLLSSDLLALLDSDAIVPLDDFLQELDVNARPDFFSGFMLNSTFRGKTWGLPFQRSTPVLYYNKDLFRTAGLDPDRPPESWAEQMEYAQRLTLPDGARWGLEIPADGMPYWLFQAIAIGNQQNVVGDSGNVVYFDHAAVVEALQAWRDAANSSALPRGLTPWATAPTDFTAGRAAMIWHSSGSLSNILREARFDVGVANLPGLKRYGTPTGGGNLYLFKKSEPNERRAAWRFMQFLTSAPQAAAWSIQTGYVATRPSSYQLPVMKQHLEKTPQALVARDQLQFSGKELATHSGPQVQKLLSDAVQAALLGNKTPAQALAEAQRDANRLLARFQD